MDAELACPDDLESELAVRVTEAALEGLQDIIWMRHDC